jgi:hypothetical protein
MGYLTWPDLTWPDLTWPDLTWPDLTWPDLTWPCSRGTDLNMMFSKLKGYWPDLTWPYLIRPDQMWQDLTWIDHTILYVYLKIFSKLKGYWPHLTWPYHVIGLQGYWPENEVLQFEGAMTWPGVTWPCRRGANLKMMFSKSKGYWPDLIMSLVYWPENDVLQVEGVFDDACRRDSDSEDVLDSWQVVIGRYSIDWV